MSGAEDLARLTQTIDKTDELLLSPDIKLVEVSPGVWRPTNAMVMANLATLLGGAMPYPSVALGLVGTVDGTNFSVLSSAEDEYVNVYRNSGGLAVFIDSYPNAKATRRASSLAETAYGLSSPRSLDPDMPWAVTDQNYQPILGAKRNGTAHAILDSMPGLTMLGDYRWALPEDNGVVLLGFKWDGEVIIYGHDTGPATSFVAGPVGGQDVWVLIDGVPYQLTSSGDNFSPRVASGSVTYMRRNGPLSMVKVDLPTPGSVAGFVTALLHILSSGQSLSMGATATATTLQPPTANRLLTLQDGARLSNQDDTLTAAMVAPFKPLVTKSTELPAVQLSAQLNRIRGIPSNAGLLTSCHGRGGFAIASLSKGTLPYANSITAVTNAKAEATRLGYGYRVPFVDWIQGENDANRAAGVYLAALLQLQTDYDIDIRGISGQAQTVPLLLDQISNWTMYSTPTSFVPLEQLQAALTYPTRFYCAGPKYWLQTSPDGIHLGADNSMRLGAMHARAAQAIISGASWKPTHVVSATRSGTVVTLRFHTPSGPLAIDTVNVTDPGNLGIRYVDDSGVATIQGVRLLGNNTVEVILSAVPTGTNAFIGIADIGTVGAAGGPVTGPRACLRDSSPDLDAYGQPLYNWACHQRVSVLAA
ncbi:hypothetical protein I8746_05265 [Pseudomonas sp. USTB-Z]|uniref:hypothetical protein n=1 Tax=Pseudomonas sp. USTB-Z TaxID=2794351 RepID=UPI001C828E43|nr:hypothetical protein [Pseudomonas sp. USTB-Z]MBX6689006.1 hypothetical protein [Pseudomonas sp. USTB-Z]